MNLISANGMQNVIGNKIPNVRIACNGDATELYQFLSEFPYILLFTGERPSVKMANGTYDLYDNLLVEYRKTIKAVIVTNLVPMGLKGREIILDLDGALYENFNITDHPLMVLVDREKYIRSISDHVSLLQVKQILSKHHHII
ncbi:hypothetical protein [Winogradskyella sp.]|uniref:hypothetical protein n=1 Tax=Winogradskyella sp. TaxID=1883156 RepID=UPI00262E7B65|nr:hypothetical protein [Winogradskyella sp.]